MSGLLLAVDPSLRASGWSLWQMGGKCLRSGLVRAPAMSPGRMAWEVWAWFRDVLGPGSGPLALAMERAPVTTRRANPADLFSPGIAAGLWIAYWRAYCERATGG